ncbi:diacylglycerol kinase [Ostreibacterium oceani]|uniref:Diacylglycerol kinase n=1 Tax=Ostreibacterium oceani TaxID=2654998 RepID=A0A6N7ETT3_9GAMM|nr:diacylglycerol kinase [Ostreibacterium oceani]MPV86224.1 diacylglycerol kinase [Ostreibacterium oceani]
MKPKRQGLSRLIHACRYSKQGFINTFKGEAAFRQECAAIAVLLPLSFVIAASAIEWLLLVTSLGLILLAELFNSAIESVVDRFDEQHPDFGKAKDAGSAAVSVTLIMAVITWITILLL